MITLEPIYTILIALLLLFLLPSVCRTLRQRLETVFTALVSFLHGALLRAERSVSNDGRLSLPHIVAQLTGAVTMTVACVVLALSDWKLTLATLAPMLDIPVPVTLGSDFEQLLGLSIVLLAVVFGLIVSDLLRWTFLTRFAVIERGHIAAFCTALLCFVASLIVAVALAAYRLPALMFDGSAMSPVDTALWLQSLPMIILLSLAVLLFIGVAFAFTSIETLLCAVLALLLSMSSVVAGVTYAILKLLDVILDIVLACADTLTAGTAPASATFRSGVDGAVGWMRKSRQSFADKLNHLLGVDRRDTIAQAKEEV